MPDLPLLEPASGMLYILVAFFLWFTRRVLGTIIEDFVRDRFTRRRPPNTVEDTGPEGPSNPRIDHSTEDETTERVAKVQR